MAEFLCYSQFEREYQNFLQRLKREQEDELDELINAGRLNIVKRVLYRLIEEATDDSSLKYRPESTGTDISLLEKLRTVSKLQNDPIFKEKPPEPLLEPKVKRHKTPPDVSHVDVASGDGAAGAGAGEYSGPDDDDSDPGVGSQEEDEGEGVECGPVASSGTQCEAASTLETSPALEDDSDSSDSESESEYRLSEDIVALQREQWGEIRDELFRTVEDRKVSGMDTFFRTKLTRALGSGPDKKMRECKNNDQTDDRMSVKELGKCYIHIGLAEVHRGNADKASTAYQEALIIALEEDDKELHWSALEGLGVVEHMNDHADKAVKYFKSALAILDNEWSTSAITSAQDRITARMGTLGHVV